MNYPTVLLTQEENAYISRLFEETDEEPEDNEVDYAVEESDEGQTTDQKDEDEVAYIATEDLRIIEENLSNQRFIHGRKFSTQQEIIPSQNTWELIATKSATKDPFLGIRLDTCCNRTSIMRMKLYISYCTEFDIKPTIKPAQGRGVNGIGGGLQGLGFVLIEIPFNDLGLVINVEFLLLK